jgi:hypothetical protein
MTAIIGFLSEMVEYFRCLEIIFVHFVAKYFLPATQLAQKIA